MRHPFRSRNLSPRLLPFYALALVGVLLAEPTPAGFALGSGIVCAGAGLRLWGAGHLIKTERLTVTGPYAYLRHPLYAGTLLLAVGFGTIAGAPGLLLVAVCFLPFFFLHYLPRKERVEGERLAARYGEAFEAYRRTVPALIPARTPWTPPAQIGLDTGRTWSRARCAENDEFGTLVGVIFGLGLLAARAVV